MNILITAGGTEEPIDEVRSITNEATGRLGVELAHQALQKGFEVTFVTTPRVDVSSIESDVTLFVVKQVNELMNVLQEQLENKTFDAVIHTMAVSDYQLVGFATEEQIQQCLTEEDEWRQYQFSQLFMHPEESKISSKHEGLYLKLIPTPKVIQFIKQWQPSILLVGFKLLVDATQEELILAAHRQQELAHSDFVIINNKNDVHHERHVAHLVKGQEIVETYHTKKEIAAGILKHIVEG